MPHRDDLDAALARIRALEREAAEDDRAIAEREAEIERLRREVERLEHPGREEDRAPPRDAHKQKESVLARWKALPEARRKWALFIGIVTTLVVINVVQRVRHALALKNGPAQLLSARTVQDKKGSPRLLLLSWIKTPQLGVDLIPLPIPPLRAYRLETIDPFDGVGRRAKLEYESDRPDIHPAGRGTYWLHRKDPPSLELRRQEDHGVVGSHAGPFHGGLSYLGHGPDALVLTSTGDGLVLDARTMKTRTAPPGKDSTEFRIPHYTWLEDDEVDGVSYRFESAGAGERKRLALGSQRTTSAGSQDTFLEPRYLVAPESGKILVLPGREGVLVRHRSELGSGGVDLVSRVTFAGRKVWTRRLAPGAAVFHTIVHRDVVVLVVNLEEGQDHIVALDWKTGKEVWRRPT